MFYLCFSILIFRPCILALIKTSEFFFAELFMFGCLRLRFKGMIMKNEGAFIAFVLFLQREALYYFFFGLKRFEGRGDL